MADEPDPAALARQWLSKARLLIPAALGEARATTSFPGRWYFIVSKLEQLPPVLSNLSTHPFFSKNSIFREQLQSVCGVLEEVISLTGFSATAFGKLQMQSYLDSLSSKLDLNLRDCNQLIKTGFLGDTVLPLVADHTQAARIKVRELLVRLQIGTAETKHRALEDLVEAINKDEKSVHLVLSTNSISALVQLLAVRDPRTRENAAEVVSTLAESSSSHKSLESQGALSPLIRLVESGTLLGREKAVLALKLLSISADIVCTLVRDGAIRPLIEACRIADSVIESAAAATLKNLSAVPEVRQSVADEGVIKLMIHLLDSGIMLESREHAAECLRNLTACNESLRYAVVAKGGIRTLLAYLVAPHPPEPAVAALKNLVSSISISVDKLISIGLLPCLVHVMRKGSIGAQQAAISIICRISSSPEAKKLVGEFGCMPLLVNLLSSKSNGAREVAAQAVAGLITCSQNCMEVKKDEKSVPNLVLLLDSGSENTSKKHAVSCLLQLSSSKKCKKLMCCHGAISYLKKLSEMEVAGAKKLLDRLEKGKARSFFSRN